VTIVLVSLLAYLIGSIQFGVLVSRALGRDVRGNDFPGFSGMLRQFGWRVGLSILALDVGKGALTAWLMRAWIPGLEWFAPLLVGLGHCWPIFYAFRGGQGLAPMAGAVGFLNLLVLWPAVLLGLGLMLLHKVFRLERFVKLLPLPFAALAVAPTVVILGWRLEGQGLPLLLALIALVLRGSQVLSGSKRA
jgi:acyl phosphate:glycerol-3-phosphate acyltransferase